MLTATYSLIALSIEQRNVRRNLSAIEQNIRMRALDPERADISDLEEVIEQLSYFERYCQERKVEKYVIPALKKSVGQAETLLLEVDSLRHRESSILDALHERKNQALGPGARHAKELCHAMEYYCASLSERLSKEEQLLSMAEDIIPGEEWFAIASGFLHDAQSRLNQHRHHL